MKNLQKKSPPILTVLFLCSITCFAQATEADKPSEELRNTLSMGVSILGWSNYNNVSIPGELQYRRMFTDNLSWSILLGYSYGFGHISSYDWDGTGKDPYRNTVRQNITLAAGRIHYSLGVGRMRRVYLTGGGGIGLGYHHLPPHKDNRDIKGRVLPYLTAELQWEFLIGRRSILRISPFLLSPSRVYFSPFKLDDPVDIPFVMFDIIHFSYGFRF